MAGAGPARIALLAGAMALLQFSIGAANDVVDAPADAGRKPRKPIPRGLVGEGTARRVALGCLILGLLLAGATGPVALVIASAGAATGYLYDLRLKGGALSWLPFSVGIPLVPVFAWAGATGGLPAAVAVLVPLAAAAGGGIAIANALADLERDRGAGVGSVATALGPRRAWLAAALLEGASVAGALGSLLAQAGSGPSLPVLAGLGAGTIMLAVGLGLGRPGAPAAMREAGWEVQAAGIGLVGLAWVAGMVGLGGSGGQ